MSNESWETNFKSPGLVNSSTRTLAQQNAESADSLIALSNRMTESAAQTARERAGYSETMIKALKRQIEPLESKLQPDEEIGALLTNFGIELKIRVHSISHEDPHLVVIKGIDEHDESVTLFQHVSQVNILFRKLKVKPGRQARRIGFV